MDEILNAYYPIYNETFDCQGVYSGSSISLNGTVEKYGYCVQIDRQVMVDTEQGKRLYVLVTGDLEFDEHGEKRLKGHALSGLVGMFVLKPDNQGWQVESANPTMDAGASGYGLHDWKLIPVAPNKYGFINEHSDMHQGYFHAHLVLLIPHGNEIIADAINSEFSDVGTDLCDGQDQPKCENIDAKIYKVDTSSVVNGYYPIQMVVNGNLDGQIYQNVKYTLTYEPNQGYQAPSDYPLDRGW